MSNSVFTLVSPVAGTVLRVEAAAGQAISPGDLIAIVESMKMEIPIEAERAGRIAELKLAEGAQVGEGDVIALFGPA